MSVIVVEEDRQGDHPMVETRRGETGGGERFLRLRGKLRHVAQLNFLP